MKWIFVLVLVGIIIYTFRDTAGPILEELKNTTPAVVAGICAMTLVYHLIEGGITTLLAKQYNPVFTYRAGVTNAFFCSFYRVATLGSGAGVAAIVYLGENGVEHSKGFGMYMIQYAFHKISIALYSAILFGISWTYMCERYGNYGGLLIAGYILTIIITVCLILFCCSVRFHKLIFIALEYLDRLLKGRFTGTIEKLHEQCGMLEQASRFLLKKKKLVLVVIVLNLVKLCFWYGIPYLTFHGNGELDLVKVMAITSLSVMLAAVIPAPAGIGSTELVFTSLFAGIVGTGLAGSASLLYRFGTFVFPFMVGAVVVIVRHIRARRTRFEVFHNS